ncbi:MAG: HIT family protein [Actinobacteria bacterium]|nr:HIT family protein [Actinomycetota bacterium]
MPTVFTRIIDGEIPGTFVWRDDECVAFLSINPVNPGHTLVVPRAQVDEWTDLPPALAAHLMTVAHTIGQAVRGAFTPIRVGLLIAGLEVPHTHLHVMPIHSGESDLHLDRAGNATPEELAEAAEKIRAALRDAGASGVSE